MQFLFFLFQKIILFYDFNKLDSILLVDKGLKGWGYGV